MGTRIEAIDVDSPDRRLLRRAARLIIDGEVLVCPTDTGYAFAANALDEKAVARVFNLKGRAYSNPIHVTVSSITEAKNYAYVNEAARHLARRFLPGALTLVLPKKEIVPSLLVAGRNTIGIRVPDNKVILGLAKMTKLPLTSTSANISGWPSPLTAEEVFSQLGNKVDLIIDGGHCPGGKESTVVDVTGETPVILREGAISREELEQVCGSIVLKEGD